MDRIRIRGGRPLSGEIAIGGAKNAALPLMAAGLLGPVVRRERLLSELGPEAGRLRARLRAPVGLDLGAASPEAIALSIVAEIQAVLSGTHDIAALSDKDISAVALEEPR